MGLPGSFDYFQGGEKLSRRGYWGDILASPYLAFGITSEDKSFFKKSNNVYTKVFKLIIRMNEFSATSHKFMYCNVHKSTLPLFFPIISMGMDRFSEPNALNSSSLNSEVTLRSHAFINNLTNCGDQISLDYKQAPQTYQASIEIVT